MTTAPFPACRLRRLRAQPWVRSLVREVRLAPQDLIWPVFVTDGPREAVPAMPGVERLPIPDLVEEAKRAQGLGIPAVALFPVVPPGLKDDAGSEALNPDNLICRAIRALAAAVPGLGLIADVALDPYTAHGHDGVLRGGVVVNDESVEVLARQALLLARAGAGAVAPSDMMDGRVAAMRAALEGAGLPDTLIISYAAKYASAFYGPFRAAIGSDAALKGDKRTYQIGPPNAGQALREVAQDVAEGADAVIVKPALPYLDIVSRVACAAQVPVFAYQVSGEYAMLRSGAVPWERALMESLTGIKRAGATAILTYAAPEAAALAKSG
ncbi:MAG TPA: porphobilinogen synthase [Rhodospirillaceae bacterium]|jgi:porphobilinogen synthase|nr:porphobilinogen synthase [Alphaproteobacteria bacterium]HBH27214.1 porphobilinogen synthase [Rhodospirillaceae bacterium]